MKKIVIIVLISLILCSCNSKNETFTYEKIDATKMEELTTTRDYIILDVRTKSEYNELHIKDALNIPYDTINTNTNLDKDKLIFVYCQSGKRSEIATKNLIELGYTAYDLGAITNIDLEKE